MDITKKNLIFINKDTYIFLDADRIYFRNDKGYFDVELTKPEEVYRYICKRKIDLCEVTKIQNCIGKELLAVIRLLVGRQFAYYDCAVHNDIFFMTNESYQCWEGGWSYDIPLNGENKLFAFIYNIKENFEFHKFYAVYLVVNKISSCLIIRINNYEEYKSYSTRNIKVYNIELNVKKVIFNTIIYLRSKKEYLDIKCLELQMDLTEAHVINKPIIDYADNLLDFFKTIEKFNSQGIRLQREDINQTVLSKWKLNLPGKSLMIGGESHMIALENAIITLFEEAYLNQIKKNEELICIVFNKNENVDKTKIFRRGMLKYICKHLPNDVCFRDISISYNKNSKLLFYEKIIKNHYGNTNYKFYVIQSNIIVAKLLLYKYSVIGIGDTYENALICAYKSTIFSFINHKFEKNKIYSWMLEESKIEIDISEVRKNYYIECISKTNFYEICKIGRKNDG